MPSTEYVPSGDSELSTHGTRPLAMWANSHLLLIAGAVPVWMEYSCLNCAPTAKNSGAFQFLTIANKATVTIICRLLCELKFLLLLDEGPRVRLLYV